ncbi:MAG: IS66 family transposase [Parvularcula sp.]|jgi:transposase|nr:IS66 family transposase [Parvularcula sp.]
MANRSWKSAKARCQAEYDEGRAILVRSLSRLIAEQDETTRRELVRQAVSGMDQMDAGHKDGDRITAGVIEQQDHTIRLYRKQAHGPTSERSKGRPNKKGGKTRKPRTKSAPADKRADNHEGKAARSLNPNLEHEKRQKYFPENLPFGSREKLISFGVRRTTRVHVEPVKVKYITVEYETLYCPFTGRVYQIEVDSRFMQSKNYTEGTAAWAIVSRFADGLPWHRLERLTERAGHKISRSQFVRMAADVAKQLEPLYDAILRFVRSGHIIGVDETVIRVVEGGKGKARQRYMVALMRNPGLNEDNEFPAAAFVAPVARSTKDLDAALGDAWASIIADGYKPWEKIAERIGEDRLQGCWAHARRKFVELKPGAAGRAGLRILELINQLFALEQEIEGKNTNDRHNIRQQRAKPIISEIKRLADDAARRVSKKTPMGKALSYMLERWGSLELFLSDGRLVIHNNHVENIIRYIVILRNAVRTCNKEHGANVWAVFATIIQTATLNGVDPYKYLLWVMNTLGKGHPIARIDELMPWYFDERNYDKVDPEHGEIGEPSRLRYREYTLTPRASGRKCKPAKLRDPARQTVESVDTG